MAKNNDARILALKKLIEEKREKLGDWNEILKTETNCVFIWNNEKKNIRVLREDELPFFISLFHSLIVSAETQDLPLASVKMSGNSVQGMLNDCKARFTQLTKAEELRDLQRAEAKLDKLLSEDKKTELELDDLEGMLKGDKE
ncbi:hypothetical protein TSARBOMBA_224 [Bacillus phage TsarBomba]|uniref:Uncharacterized protein n=1 Tax=Bacillus phage TsarBomba TaxID=1690456 RepID=A0A0K2D010_9CAUD|nr:hypothetical protein TSARBOMBA_224 [Bacillus phage TsarBomba]ALA13063.1 hypothetical protein TSARBOMBA_224 [Bacillus phage TsarBomba]